MINAHPALPKFEYLRPDTLSQACKFLAGHTAEARPLTGGTDIFVRMRDGVWKDKYLVDIKGFEGMGELFYDPLQGLTIGAAVNMNQVIAHPRVREHYLVLVESAKSVASYQLRNRATIVGNICNASPAGDTIGACLLLEAVLNVQGVEGVRQEPLGTFFLGPGMTKLKAGDIVTSIHLPSPPPGFTGTYIKLGRNKASDLSIVGVTAVGYPDGSAASGYRFKLALASVAPVPLVVPAVEDLLSQQPITEGTLIEAADKAMEACTPIDDVRASARYRKLMARNLSLKALKEVWHGLS